MLNLKGATAFEECHNEVQCYTLEVLLQSVLPSEGYDDMVAGDSVLQEHFQALLVTFVDHIHGCHQKNMRS